MIYKKEPRGFISFNFLKGVRYEKIRFPKSVLLLSSIRNTKVNTEENQLKNKGGEQDKNQSPPKTTISVHYPHNFTHYSSNQITS